jgi:enoyl-CoA hydratase/carnithine racemase
MVNGLALGGGCELAMACDIIIASENAQFGQPEINVGVIPGAGGTQILPRLVGEKKAKELVFTGAFISAQEALALGLVNKVVPQEKLRDTTVEMARAMLRHSPVILKLCKLAINKSLDVPLSIGPLCHVLRHRRPERRVEGLPGKAKASIQGEIGGRMKPGQPE